MTIDIGEFWQDHPLVTAVLLGIVVTSVVLLAGMSVLEWWYGWR